MAYLDSNGRAEFLELYDYNGDLLEEAIVPPKTNTTAELKESALNAFTVPLRTNHAQPTVYNEDNNTLEWEVTILWT